MRKRILILLCLSVLFVGCEAKAENGIEDTVTDSNDDVNVGVYYSSFDEKDIGQVYNPFASYLYSLVHYDGNYYTTFYRCSSENKADLNLDSIIGDKIGTIYGNNGLCWSMQSDELAEATYEGTIYQVNGYDEPFRICIYYETTMPSTEVYYHLCIFDHLNDITLRQGKELFEERLHLERSTALYYDPNVGEESSFDEDSWSELSMEDESVKEFLSALFDGEFIESDSTEANELESLGAYPFAFVDSRGLITKIKVYQEGYVTMENSEQSQFIVKLDAEKCKEIIR